jgi:uncharacterized protein YdhG (YjbR/CyaY superfamily)
MSRIKMKSKPAARSIDEYIAGYPPDVRRMLLRLRKTIQAAASDAEETMSYRIPTFRDHGYLVHFAAWKHHISFCPTSSGIRQFAKELSGFKQSRGTVHFPLDRPIPVKLVSRIVKFRLKENRARAKAGK